MSLGRHWGWLGLLLVSACSRPAPYHQNDVLIRNTDQKVLGTIVQLDDHTFPSGITEPSALVRLATGGTEQHWYALQVLAGNYSVQGAPAR